MTEALALALIGWVCNEFAAYCYDQMIHSDMPVGGDTEIGYSTYITGECNYTLQWVSDFHTAVETATFRLAPETLTIEGVPFIDGDYVKWYSGGEGATAATASVGIINGSYYSLYINPEGFHYYCTVNGGGGSTYSTQSTGLFIDSRAISTYKYWINSDSGGSLSSSDNHIATITEVKATSSPVVKNNYPDCIYVPAPAGNKMTYNEYREEVINYVNNTFNFNFTLEDAPEFDDIYPTEETEETTENSGGCNCNIDYDEILGENELESILTQETYEVSEIESITETIIIDIEDLVIEDDTEYQQITQCVPDMLAVGMGVFNELNVAAALTSAAIIACIWKIIRGA